MRDPAYDRFTLLGMAYDTGFNSQSTFHRAFKEVTGKTPAEYKKELPFYNLTYRSGAAALISTRKLNRINMFKNYLKMAWRNMLYNKGYSALNITGLAAGMAVALLIGLWVYNEYSYDRFLPGYQQLYQVRRNFVNNGEILNFTSSSLKLADVLRRDIPEIENVAESDWMGSHGLMVGNKKFYISGGQTASDFLEMFQYPLLEGNASLVLKDPYSIVLTESTARTLFGNENPINKTVRFDNKNDLKVTGILKDLPANSTFRFNFLVPFTYYEQTSEGVKGQRAAGFDENAYQIFVRAQARPAVHHLLHETIDSTVDLRRETLVR